MVTYEFLENNPELVKEFYQKRDLIGPRKYVIAVGAFEDGELIELFTVGKPPKDNKKYVFVVNSFKAETHIQGMLEYFHHTYDGKIEGLE